MVLPARTPPDLTEVCIRTSCFCPAVHDTHAHPGSAWSDPAPRQVFHCFWDTAMVYVMAQLLGAAIAAAMMLLLYGFGQFGSLFDTRVFGFLGLAVPAHLRQQARLRRPPPLACLSRCSPAACQTDAPFGPRCCASVRLCGACHA